MLRKVASPDLMVSGSLELRRKGHLTGKTSAREVTALPV